MNRPCEGKKWISYIYSKGHIQKICIMASGSWHMLRIQQDNTLEEGLPMHLKSGDRQLDLHGDSPAHRVPDTPDHSLQ
jgi:hypothetical protein